MHLDLTNMVDWLARIVGGATVVRIGLHWAKDGFAIWIKPESQFWAYFQKLDTTIAWLAGSITKYGKKSQVVEEAIKDLLEQPQPPAEVNVTVETKP